MRLLVECREMVRLRERHVTGFSTWDINHDCSLVGLMGIPSNEFKDISPIHMVDILRDVSTIIGPLAFGLRNFPFS